MIHTAKVLVFAPGGMAALFEFLRERLRSLFRASAVKRDELPRHEVAGVGRNDIEEAGLLLQRATTVMPAILRIILDKIKARMQRAFVKMKAEAIRL